MLLDPIIISLCMGIAKYNSSASLGACEQAMNATMVQTQTTDMSNKLEKFSQDEVIDFLGKTIVYTGVGMVATFNAVQQKEIMVKTPFQPWAETISFDLTPARQSYFVNWKWGF